MPSEPGPPRVAPSTGTTRAAPGCEAGSGPAQVRLPLRVRSEDEFPRVQLPWEPFGARLSARARRGTQWAEWAWRRTWPKAQLWMQAWVCALRQVWPKERPWALRRAWAQAPLSAQARLAARAPLSGLARSKSARWLPHAPWPASNRRACPSTARAAAHPRPEEARPCCWRLHHERRQCRPTWHARE